MGGQIIHIITRFIELKRHTICSCQSKAPAAETEPVKAVTTILTGICLAVSASICDSTKGDRPSTFDVAVALTLPLLDRYPASIVPPPEIEVADTSYSVIELALTLVKESPVRVPAITSSQYAEPLPILMSVTISSICARLVRLLNVVFGRMDRIGRRVVTLIVVIPLPVACGKPRSSSSPLFCTEQHSKYAVPPFVVLVVEKNIPLSASNLPMLNEVEEAHVLPSIRTGKLYV